jgi:ABC-type nickel/cobalt efflux system permease component RcnA
MLMSTLGLGFLIGMHHATEPDHVAAVCSVASRRSGIRAISMHGAFWGIGHTLTLVAVAGTCLVMRTTVPDSMASRLEFAVGLMLVGLGSHVLYRLWRDKVHFHTHRHGSGSPHFHAHSHRSERIEHAASPHDHPHVERLPWRTLAVGLMHGMAGSAALIVMTAATLESPMWGLAYVLVFGIGTTVGMALLSAIIAAPITLTARSLTFANRALQLVIGIMTCGVGISILLETSAKAFASS